jgi:hypothetical protein
MMETEVLNLQGTYLMQTLPNGQMGSLVWTERWKEVEVEPEKVIATHDIAAPDADLDSCPAFFAQLVLGEEEYLVTVFANKIGDVIPALYADHGCNCLLLDDGWKIMSVWEVQNANEF